MGEDGSPWIPCSVGGEQFSKACFLAAPREGHCDRDRVTHITHGQLQCALLSLPECA